MASGSDLPSEIIEDILYRLPTKSLVRFISVSKPWSCLISEWIKTRKRTKLLLLQLDEQSIYSIDICWPGKSQHNTATPEKLSFHEDRKWNILHINGLVLARDNDNTFFLLNPTTCELKKLPPLPFHHKDHRHPYGYDENNVMYGLGYDSSSHDYKVVVASAYMSNFECPFAFDFVYSLTRDSWSIIEDGGSLYYSPVYWPTFGIFLNGYLHWLLMKDFSPKASFIGCFGLANEKSGALQLPEYQFLVDDDEVEKEQRPSQQLYTLGGFLCFVVFENAHKAHFWVMKEYGMSESWTKIFIYDSQEVMTMHVLLLGDEAIVFAGSYDLEKNVVAMFPFNVMETHESIGLLGDEEALSNIISDGKEGAELVGMPVHRIPLPLNSLNYVGPGIYVESLVSLNDHHAIEEQ